MGIFLISILLVAVLTFLLTLAVFKRIKRGANPFKNSIFWITIVIALPIIYAGILFTWYKISSSYPERSFDKYEWIQNKDKRYEYVEDLVNHNKLNGMTKSEVIDLLGKASNENDSMLTYYIGYSPKIFFNLDPDWLEIEIKNEIVETVRVIP